MGKTVRKDVNRMTYLKEYRADPVYKVQRAVWLEKNCDYYSNWLKFNPDYHRKWRKHHAHHYRKYQKKWRSEHQKEVNDYMRKYMRFYRQRSEAEIQ